MPSQPAPVSDVWARQPRMRISRFEDDVVEPMSLSCDVARHEMQRLHAENSLLRSAVQGLTQTVILNEPKEVPFSGSVSSTFSDGLTPSTRRDVLEQILESINGPTLVKTGDPMGIACGEIVQGPVSPRMSGGVFLLLGAEGLDVGGVGKNNTETVYRVTSFPNLEMLRTLVEESLRKDPNMQLFSSLGMLQVPCQRIRGSALLYGRLGITVRGDRIKTVGEPVGLGDPTGVALI